MRSGEPSELASDVVLDLLRRCWQLEVEHVAYAAVGHGSFHWIAYRRHRPAWFVTGDPVDSARLTELRASARVAHDLAVSGHAFVVAPVADREGALVRTVQEGWALHVSPWMAGTSTEHDVWTAGSWSTASEQTRIARIIGRLHAVPAPAYVPLWDPTPPHRVELESALSAVDRAPVASTPVSRRTQVLVMAERHRLQALLTRYDELVVRVRADEDPWVLTHGEPDSDNVIRTADGRLLLIDWTTVAIGPRERDLFDVMQGPHDVLADYLEAAGPHRPRRHALEMIGLHWRLSHLGHDLHLLLHHDRATGEEDVQRAWTRLGDRLAGPPGTYLLG